MKAIITFTTFFLFTLATLAGTFVEPFDDKKLEDWEAFNMRDDIPGSWEILDGELHGENPTGVAHFLTTGDETWKDYSIEVHVMPLKKHGPGYIGLLARLNHTRSIWCVIGDWPFDGGASKITCLGGSLQANRWTLFYTARQKLLKLKIWSRLKFSIKGDVFVFSINDKEIVTTGKQFIFFHEEQKFVILARDLSDFPSGGAGFGASNYTAKFDNVTIIGDDIPNKGGFPVSPRAKLSATWGRLKQF